MASEITLTIKMEFAKGSTSTSLGVNDLSIDVTGTMLVHHRQEIGTSAEALDLGGISTGGYMVAINRDATNFVQLQHGNETALARLSAGECACFRVDSGATPNAIADTAACELEYLLIEA